MRTTAREPETIDYADALSQHATVVIRPDGTFRITVRRRWPKFPPIVSFLLFFILLPAVFRLPHFVWNGNWRLAIASAIFIIVAAAIFLNKRWRRPAIITASADELTFQNCVREMASDTVEPFVRCKRSAVYRIECKAAAAAIFVWAHGEEMLELSLPLSTAAQQRLAELLNEQLALDETRRESAEVLA